MRHSLLVHIHCYLSLSRHTCKNIVKCVCMFNVKLLYINIIIIWLHWPMHSPRTTPRVLHNPVWFSRHSAVVANNQNYSDMNTLLLHEYQYCRESSDNIVISWCYIDPQFFISNLVLLIIFTRWWVILYFVFNFRSCHTLICAKLKLVVHSELYLCCFAFYM